VHEGDPSVQIGPQPVDERECQGDLRDEDEGRATRLERMGDRLDIDRGLAAAGDPVEQEGPRVVRVDGGLDPGDRLGLCRNEVAGRRPAAASAGRRAASGRLGRSRTSASASPRRTSPATAPLPCLPARSAAGNSQESATDSSMRASTWRDPSGRPSGRPPATSVTAIACPVSPRRIQRSYRGPAPAPSRVHSRLIRPARSRAFSRRSRPARPSGPARSRTGRGPRSSCPSRSRATGSSGSVPAGSGPTSATSSRRSSNPGGSMARSTSAGGAR
jgi:hypothetical protein